jgi:hypothetical protein
MKTVLLLSVLLSNALSQQTTKLFVCDSLTKAPLENAIIFDLSKTLLGYTSAEGIVYIAEQTDSIFIDYVGYKPRKQLIVDTIKLVIDVYAGELVEVFADKVETMMERIIENLESDADYYGKAVFKDSRFRNDSLMSYSEFGLDVHLSVNQVEAYYISSLGRSIKRKGTNEASRMTISNRSEDTQIGTGSIAFMDEFRLKQNSISMFKRLFGSVSIMDLIKLPFRDDWNEYFSIDQLENYQSSTAYGFAAQTEDKNWEGSFVINSDDQIEKLIAETTLFSGWIRYSLEITRSNVNSDFVLSSLKLTTHVSNSDSSKTKLISNLIFYDINEDDNRFDKDLALKIPTKTVKSKFKFFDHWIYKRKETEQLPNYSPVDSTIIKAYSKEDFDGIWY